MSGEFVEIVEVGLRDGLQIRTATMPTGEKLDWLMKERAAGVRVFEVASFVPPKYLPQMADAAELVRAAVALPDLTVKALVPNLKGAEGALAAGAQVLIAPVSASEAHSAANVRRTPDEMVAEVGRVCLLRDEVNPNVRVEAGIATAFGCTLQGKVPEDEVRRLAAACIEAGADAVGLADTVGYATPAQVGRIFRDVRAEIGDKLHSAHFHDTRGMGLANVLAALEAGVRSFDSSLGGLGGCPFAPGASGNVATEDLAFMLDSMGFETGIDLDKLIEAGALLRRLLPDDTLYGRLTAAGLPKSYHPQREVA
jgi:hydroxymethylglutaryl-CoA lyase